MARTPPFQRFVALGDSLTEGLCDPAPTGTHPWRGWADRVAETLAGLAETEGTPFAYANLAVRGRLLTEVIAEQVPTALELRPDLVSLIGGGNDVLRPGVDLDVLAARLDGAVEALTAAGATVLLATAYDPRGMTLVRRTRGVAAVFTANIWTIARRHGACVLDLWGMQALYHPQLWAPDRIHLTAAGHERVAQHALHTLGVPVGLQWRVPLPPGPARSRRAALAEDAAWLRDHVLPWVGRRVRGQSSGDGLQPKRPVPGPVDIPLGEA